jgi:hypothetical protein
MRKANWLIPACLALTALLAAPAKAQEVFDPFENDGMCQDMTGNWVQCSSLGEDGISGGGSAPGMNSCTSTKGCKKCVIPDGQRTESCATELYSDGYCNCGITSAGSCMTSGACKYVH